MTRHLITAFTVLALALGLRGGDQPADPNAWPVWTAKDQHTKERPSWEAAGPLFFQAPAPGDDTYQGVRPLYLERRDARGVAKEATILYPIFQIRWNDVSTDWTIFNLINSSRPHDPASAQAKALDVWPFYFSRNTGDPASSYQGLFPVAGTIKARFGYDRLHWAVFPLFWQSERNGVVTTSTPWPFIKRTAGNGTHGLTVWPLFGHIEKPGVYRKQFYLWPLIYKNESHLSEAHPTEQLGFLPFYSMDRRAGAINENYLWPFFGYTDQQLPVRYHETRYLWPFLVQGRGDTHYVNRWAPVYTHSIRKGVDKQWYLWPLFRREQWQAEGLVQTKRQFVWFIYWSMEQRSADNPRLAPATKTHLWPLISYWNNGAGRRQVQVLSPFDEFFPYNDKVRQLYTPLFALYRYDQRSPDDVRQSLLWNAITWRHSPTRREFHLGPLFSTQHSPAGDRVAIGRGLIGLQRPAGGAWRLFLFDFSPQKDKPVTPTSR